MQRVGVVEQKMLYELNATRLASYGLLNWRDYNNGDSNVTTPEEKSSRFSDSQVRAIRDAVVLPLLGSVTSSKLHSNLQRRAR